MAGIVTGTATNPLWVIKTRLQLEQHHTSLSSSKPKLLGGSWHTITRIFREDGIRGIYKGLSASYLGLTETTIQWTLYERLKKLTKDSEGKGGAMEWLGMLASAGTAKCVATLITYPHEVRTVILCLLRVLNTEFLLQSGHSDATQTTASQWRSQIQGTCANLAISHRRRGC